MDSPSPARDKIETSSLGLAIQRLIHLLSKCLTIFPMIFQTRDIAFLNRNLSKLDDNLFPDCNGMLYKCI